MPFCIEFPTLAKFFSLGLAFPFARLVGVFLRGEDVFGGSG